MDALRPFAGLAALMLTAWLLSEDRRRVDARAVAMGLLLQFALALALLKAPVVKDGLLALNGLVEALDRATTAGTSFVFGYLGGGPLPFDEKYPGSSFVLALKALPLILVVGALSAVLFHWRVLPLAVRAFSWLLRRSMGIGGALGVGVAVNVFVGMVEAPLFIRPYLLRLTRSELFTLMTAGMATIAGTVLVLYAGFLRGVIPDSLGHILTASLISAPAAVLVARLMVPESAGPTAGDMTPPRAASSTMDAVAKGTADAVPILIHVAAMLIVLVALVALANSLLALLPDAGGAPLTLERLLGWIMAPVVWLLGVPWQEAQTAGMLMGTKTVLNELIAYLDMARLPEGALSPHSRLVMTYAMCGFANPGSLGIMIGGLQSMAPERRAEIVGLGLKSVVAGTLATCMTGAVAAILL